MASPLDSQQEKKPRVIPSADVHDMICYGVVVLGTQTREWQGKQKKYMQVRILWEIADETHVFEEAKGPQRLQVFSDYNLFMDDKANIVKMLKAWFPALANKENWKLGDAIRGLVGKSCRGIIEHRKSKDGKSTFANISASGAAILPPKVNISACENPTFFFDFDIDKFNWDEYNKIPSWIRKTIEKSDEWPSVLAKYNQGSPAEQSAQQAAPAVDNSISSDDDLPF